MKRLKKLFKEIEPLIDTLVIDSMNRIVKLKDVKYIDDDYYYEIENDKGDTEYLSILTSIHDIKTYLPKEMYDDILYIYEVNI